MMFRKQKRALGRTYADGSFRVWSSLDHDHISNQEGLYNLSLGLGAGQLVGRVDDWGQRRSSLDLGNHGSGPD